MRYSDYVVVYDEVEETEEGRETTSCNMEFFNTLKEMKEFIKEVDKAYPKKSLDFCARMISSFDNLEEDEE